MSRPSQPYFLFKQVRLLGVEVGVQGTSVCVVKKAVVRTPRGYVDRGDLERPERMRRQDWTKEGWSPRESGRGEGEDSLVFQGRPLTHLKALSL